MLFEYFEGKAVNRFDKKFTLKTGVNDFINKAIKDIKPF